MIIFAIKKWNGKFESEKQKLSTLETGHTGFGLWAHKEKTFAQCSVFVDQNEPWKCL